MSLSLLRTAAAAVLTLAAAGGAHAQEAFVADEPIGARVEAAAPQGVAIELEAAGEATLYRQIVKHHATWLAGRGEHELAQRNVVMVYRDGVLIGGKAALRSIKVEDVAEVRRLNPAEASERFGLEHAAGAILITSK